MSLQPHSLGPIKQAWYKWKSLRWVPFRKRFLVGLDLHGTTFWEFRDSLSANPHRMRRIAQFPSSTQYSDVRISPAWHQWLRHTRRDPPSLVEQSQDVVRQEQLKVLAAQADARWAAKPSFLDAAPGRAQPLPALGVGMGMAGMRGVVGEEQSERTDEVVVKREIAEAKERVDSAQKEIPQMEVPDQKLEEAKTGTQAEKEDPWKQARGGPSEQWQPATWDSSKVTPARR